MHNMRHVIRDLTKLLPEEIRTTEQVRALAAFGCHTTMHVVRLLAPRLENENHTKDVDFSPSSIRMRWEAGFTKTMGALERAPWEGIFDAQEGVLLHEAEMEMMQAAE
jgi:NTE family protein